MAQLWGGRFTKETDQLVYQFNASISFDKKFYRQDMEGSIAHVKMLGKQGILTQQETKDLVAAIKEILQEVEEGTLEISHEYEDIHSFVEAVLIERLGDTGKKLHTGRSRNDQVALDLRLYLRDEGQAVISMIRELIGVLAEKAGTYKKTIMPGYTHLQRAQPVTFGHHLLAYAMMLIRDAGRFQDALARMNVSPLGCCALAGTTYDTDREMTARELGFDGIMWNSLDGVSDRDFCVEMASACSLLMTHLSRFSEEIILWSSWEFKFIELDDAYTTGSSIMPQKKNSDMAELVRGKTGRVNGNLMALLTMLKGLPLAYNKDMQEDKESIFDSIDTVKKCLEVFTPMIATMKVLPENMLTAAQKGFINATDLADYLVKKGVPFRSAYKTVGRAVGKCVAENRVLEALSLEEFKAFDPLFEEDLYREISLETCVEKRISAGGTSAESIDRQIALITEFLKK